MGPTMKAELQVGMLVTAWITYLSAIGVIYTVGQKATEFLNEEAIHKISEFSKERPITTTMNVILDVTLGSIDRWLGFQKYGLFYRPKIVRSVLVSLVVLALLLYPLRNAPALVFLWFGLTIGQLFDNFGFSELKEFGITGILSVVLLFGIFLSFNALSDFVSFSKTRTLMELFRRFPSPVRVLTLLFLDILFSVLIAYAVSTAPFMLFSYITILFELETLRQKLIASVVILAIAAASFFIIRRGRLVSILVGYLALIPLLYLLITLPFATTLEDVVFAVFGPMMLTIGVFIFASATGLGITILSAITAAVGLIGWAASKLEGRGIWKILNFDKKPMESAAIVAVVVFTLIYWPIVLL
jgi:hypothetical protein